MKDRVSGMVDAIEDLWRIRREALKKVAEMRVILRIWEKDGPKSANECRELKAVIAEAEDVAAGCAIDIELRSGYHVT